MTFFEHIGASLHSVPITQKQDPNLYTRAALHKVISKFVAKMAQISSEYWFEARTSNITTEHWLDACCSSDSAVFNDTELEVSCNSML